MKPRQLADPRSMRALAHPLRVATLELLLRDGPLTATQLAERLGQQPGNMSWHLNTLARYGFIEETGDGRSRARPWRLADRQLTVSALTEEQSQAATALAEFFHAHAHERLREWLANRHSYPEEWQRAQQAMSVLSYLTPSELDELGREMSALMTRYQERVTDRTKRPPDARPVNLVAFGHPVPFTAAGN